MAPTASEQAPDTASAMLVTVVRPHRSAYAPPSQQPTAPLPTTTKVTSAGSPLTVGSPPVRARSLSVTNRGIHVHIAYSSHMWPR